MKKKSNSPKYKHIKLINLIHRFIYKIDKDLNGVFWIEPKTISSRISFEGIMQLEINNFKKSRITKMNFGKYCSKLDFSSDKYQSVFQRYLINIPWERTPYYIKYQNELGRGNNRNIKNLNSLKRRYKKLDRIFIKIKKAGNLSSSKQHLITIHLDEAGNIVYGPGGSHRLFISIILGFKYIPVKIGYVNNKNINELNRMVKNRKEQLL